MSLLQRVCLPLIDGGKLESVAKAAGLRRKDGVWALRIDRKRRLELDPPDVANPYACGATIIHGVGAGPAIHDAIDDWARSQTPGLTPVKVRQASTGAIYARTTSTWEGKNAKGDIGVVLSEEKTLQGRPVDGDLDQSTLILSLTPNRT